MRAACLVPIAMLIGACGTQEIALQPSGESGDAAVERAASTPPGADAAMAAEAAPRRGCTEDGDCPQPGLHCDVARHLCFQCLMDSHCTEPSRPVCDLELDECVECNTNADCRPGTQCAGYTHRCVFSCDSASPCPDNLGCHSGICLGCTSNAACARSPAGTYCNTTSGMCVACETDSQCPGDLQCNVTGQCVKCRNVLDCQPGETCDPLMHFCSETGPRTPPDAGFGPPDARSDAPFH